MYDFSHPSFNSTSIVQFLRCECFLKAYEKIFIMRTLILYSFFVALFPSFQSQNTTGVDDGEVPPVPIPNTEVKLTRADNT